jgi:flagellar motility protein MotE (MotC chaperone)
VVLDTAVGPAADSSVSRVASVLLRLTPEDAAPIAARMADSELVPVLRRMGVDKSAPLLAKLPTARARELSRLIIAPASSGTP